MSQILLFQFLLMIQLLAKASASSLDNLGGGGLIFRVEGGDLINADGTKTHVGFYTSQIQAQVIDSLFPDIDDSEIKQTSFFNSSNLRYLDLSGGDYLSDQSLSLPSLFVLHVDSDASVSIAPNASTALLKGLKSDKPIPPTLVLLNGVSFSAVVGGTFDARSNSSFEALHIEDGSHNSIRNVVAFSHVDEAWSSTVTIRGGTRHELAHSRVNGGGLAARCAWTISTSFALVHDNVIEECIKHALDFDAYTSSSAAYNNLARHNGPPDGYGQAIFVEETASGNFIFNNTLTKNLNGIAVYSLDVGPVQGNIIANNRIEDSVKYGISAGGGLEDATRESKNNIFVGNILKNNAEGDCWIQHGSDGSVEGDYWVSNVGDGQKIDWQANPESSSAVSVFDP